MNTKINVIVLVLVIGALGLLVAAGPVQANGVPEAYFEGSVGGIIPGDRCKPNQPYDIVKGTTIDHPGSAMVNYLDRYSSGKVFDPELEQWVCSEYFLTELSGQISLAGGIMPKVAFSASGKHVFRIDAKALIIYYFMYQKIAGDVPDVPLPILISGAGRLWVDWPESCPPDTIGQAGGVVYLHLSKPEGGWFRSIVDKHSTDVPKGQVNWFTYSSSVWLEPPTIIPGTIIRVAMCAAGGSSPYGSDMQFSTGDLDAWLDPKVEIDPTHMVEYKGEMVPATSLYRLIFSPGFQPNMTPFLGLLLGE